MSALSEAAAHARRMVAEIDRRWRDANGNTRRRKAYQADMRDRALWLQQAEEIEAYLAADTHDPLF